jgi:hypothetical protein
MSRQPSVRVLVATAALLAAGCSSGGGKHAAPATTTTSTRITPSPAQIVRNLGPCPKRYPDASITKLNTGIKGIDKNLVPISASVVRICKYVLPPNANTIPAGLISSGIGVLTPPATATFEAETNRLPKADARIDCPATMPPFFFLTFANQTQQVNVWEANGCGFKTNGAIAVGMTTHWFNEVQAYALPTRHG